MRFLNHMPGCSILAAVIVALTASSVLAQEPGPYTPTEMERLVSRIALYPDPLLAQVLAAATFPDQIPEAARWADQHHYLTGDALAQAIALDHLTWDPSAQARLPFPSVLEMMARDMSWTRELGNAFLTDSQGVMDAVQRLRQKAREYGYLQSNSQMVVVDSGPYVEIRPALPDVICVPVYDPLLVFAPPRQGVVVRGGIRFAFAVTLGAAFRPWGWDGNRILWNTHEVIINNVRWDRGWRNQVAYVHPYAIPRYAVPRPPETHRLIARSSAECAAARSGGARIETHRRR
jgi:hypothetical protein